MFPDEIMHEIARAIVEEAKKQGTTKSVLVEVCELAELSAQEVDKTLKTNIYIFMYS